MTLYQMFTTCKQFHYSGDGLNGGARDVKIIRHVVESHRHFNKRMLMNFPNFQGLQDPGAITGVDAGPDTASEAVVNIPATFVTKRSYVKKARGGAPKVRSGRYAALTGEPLAGQDATSFGCGVLESSVLRVRPAWAMRADETPDGPKALSNALEGSILDSSILEGSVLEGSVLEGSVLESSVLETVEGSTVETSGIPSPFPGQLSLTTWLAGVVPVHTPDRRLCVLCGAAGDLPATCGGRLLPVNLDTWVHVNCAVWSCEVYEGEDGLLKNITQTLRHAKSMKCVSCGVSGASLGCCHGGRCKKIYHFACAMKEQAYFAANKEVFCVDHAPADGLFVSDFGMTRLVYSLAGSRAQTEPAAQQLHAELSSEMTSGAAVSLNDALPHPATCHVRMGAFLLVLPGVIIYDRPKFQSRTSLFPLNYCALRCYWGYNFNQPCYYRFEILNDADAPLFRVSSSEGLMAEATTTPGAAWKQITERLARSPAAPVAWTPPDALTMFGLSLPPVIALLEQLPEAFLCKIYLFRYFRPRGGPRTREIPVNVTGSARSEAYNKARWASSVSLLAPEVWSGVRGVRGL